MIVFEWYVKEKNRYDTTTMSKKNKWLLTKCDGPAPNVWMMMEYLWSQIAGLIQSMLKFYTSTGLLTEASVFKR